MKLIYMVACDYVMQDSEGRASAIGIFDRIELGAPHMWLPFAVLARVTEWDGDTQQQWNWEITLPDSRTVEIHGEKPHVQPSWLFNRGLYLASRALLSSLTPGELRVQLLLNGAKFSDPLILEVGEAAQA